MDGWKEGIEDRRGRWKGMEGKIDEGKDGRRERMEGMYGGSMDGWKRIE